MGFKPEHRVCSVLPKPPDHWGFTANEGFDLKLYTVQATGIYCSIYMRIIMCNMADLQTKYMPVKFYKNNSMKLKLHTRCVYLL